MKRFAMLLLVLALATPSFAQFGQKVQKARDGLGVIPVEVVEELVQEAVDGRRAVPAQVDGLGGGGDCEARTTSRKHINSKRWQ